MAPQQTAYSAGASRTPTAIGSRKKRKRALTVPPARPARVRLLMPVHDADELASCLVEVPRTAWVAGTLDQLWLRSVLIEQWRRTNLIERPAFEARANRILMALDPPEADDPTRKRR